MTDLKDKVLLITGASGIAAATVKLAVASGAKVYYTGLAEGACLELAEALHPPEKVAFQALDLTRSENAEILVSGCLQRFGRLDGLFNVAGTSGRKFGDGSLEECTEEGWTRTIQANLDIQYRMSREAIGAMKRLPPGPDGARGVILNMSSILGLHPDHKHFSALAYATAKGAIITMTRHMAAFYAEAAIRVNAIAPGLADTQMSARAISSPEILSYVEGKQPLTRGVIQVEDVAEVALFLLSSRSRIITGQTLVCDGGWSVS